MIAGLRENFGRTLRVLSWLEEMRKLPEGWKSTDWTGPVWAAKCCTRDRVRTSNT